MTAMGSLRFVLILLLTVVLDLSSPFPPQVGAEASEELEEVVHAQHGRRPFRRVRDTVAPGVAREMRTAEMKRSERLPVAPAHPRATEVRPRKLPPLLAEPSSAPEDH
jgi:hypothetical protein